MVSRSDVMVFENEIDASMYNSVGSLESVFLTFNDESNGDYYLYSWRSSVNLKYCSNCLLLY